MRFPFERERKARKLLTKTNNNFNVRIANRLYANKIEAKRNCKEMSLLISHYKLQKIISFWGGSWGRRVAPTAAEAIDFSKAEADLVVKDEVVNHNKAFGRKKMCC